MQSEGVPLYPALTKSYIWCWNHCSETCGCIGGKNYLRYRKLSVLEKDEGGAVQLRKKGEALNTLQIRGYY